MVNYLSIRSITSPAKKAGVTSPAKCLPREALAFFSIHQGLYRPDKQARLRVWIYSTSIDKDNLNKIIRTLIKWRPIVTAKLHFGDYSPRYARVAPLINSVVKPLWPYNAFYGVMKTQSRCNKRARPQRLMCRLIVVKTIVEKSAVWLGFPCNETQMIWICRPRRIYEGQFTSCTE